MAPLPSRHLEHTRSGQHHARRCRTVHQARAGAFSWSSSSPPRSMSAEARTVDRNGPGRDRPRPSLPRRQRARAARRPAPPCSSGMWSPSQPCSASPCQKGGSVSAFCLEHSSRDLAWAVRLEPAPGRLPQHLVVFGDGDRHRDLPSLASVAHLIRPFSQVVRTHDVVSGLDPPTTTGDTAGAESPPGRLEPRCTRSGGDSARGVRKGRVRGQARWMTLNREVTTGSPVV